MQLYSTKTPTLRTTLKEAIFQGMPADNGLYMPVHIPSMSGDWINQLAEFSFQEIAFEIAQSLIGAEIPANDLRNIIESSVNFPPPLTPLEAESSFILELFHGPSLAFKDFGARFMAKTMAYFNESGDKDLIILVATSGDTGGAVAAGFHRTPGIQVVILYPSGKVSPLQEKQLTALGHNVQALEIAGTFDDCQALVKQAFLDTQLRNTLRLSSANSINIARLIPQIFYYWEAYKQVQHLGKRVNFIVPSGNFGNLTATNINDIVPEYLQTGIFSPRPSEPTLSNAMDVGNPSNFARILALYGSTWNIIKEHLSGYAFTDEETESAMRQVYTRHRYTLDPHGAVGYLAWKAYHTEFHDEDSLGIILETAHPAKFLEDVERILNQKISIPATLSELRGKTKQSTLLSVDYANLKKFLLESFI